MDEDRVKTSKLSEFVWLISICRPKVRNAVDENTASLLADAFIAFERDPDARVAILFGQGGAFCAGADLGAVARGSPNRLDQVERVPREGTGACLDRSGPMGISRMLLSKPVIAAISGPCVAGGLELACWCDLRLCDGTAQFGVYCRRFGVPLIDGGTYRLPELLGLSRAMDLILTGRTVLPQEAFQIGLVNRLVDAPEQLLPAALELAEQISSFPQACMRADRLSAYRSNGRDSTDSEADWRLALRAEFSRGVSVISTESVQGAKKFTAGVGRHGTAINSTTPRSKL